MCGAYLFSGAMQNEYVCSVYFSYTVKQTLFACLAVKPIALNSTHSTHMKMFGNFA